MRRIVLAVALTIPILLQAQTYELGLQGGATNYIGDLAPSLAAKETHQHAGLFFKKNARNQYDDQQNHP